MDDGIVTNPAGLPPVLVAHEEVSTMRLVRDSLLGFTLCEVDTCFSGEVAFERCLQKRYKLIVLSLHLPVLPGELLYELLAKVQHYSPAPGRSLPPVIFVGESSDQHRVEELQRDVRVKGLLIKPLRIDRILAKAKLVLAERPMA
jgi:CheY-like chemotaxis protein